MVNVAIGVGAKISCGARPQKISNETISKRFCGNAADPALQIVKMYQHWIIEDIFLPTRRQIHQIFPRNVIEQASSTYFPLLRSLSLFQCGGETRYSSYFSHPGHTAASRIKCVYCVTCASPKAHNGVNERQSTRILQTCRPDSAQ